MGVRRAASPEDHADVTLVVDAGALYAQADRRDDNHDRVVAVLAAERGLLVTTEIAFAEADCLVLDRLGVEAELALLDDAIDGGIRVECLAGAALRKARQLCDRYRDLQLGLADASLIVIAETLGTRRILTLDERHFRAVQPVQGGHFTILPADA